MEKKKKEINQQVLLFQLSVEMNIHLPEQVIVRRNFYLDLQLSKEATPKSLLQWLCVCVWCVGIYIYNVTFDGQFYADWKNINIPGETVYWKLISAYTKHLYVLLNNRLENHYS